MTRSIGAVHPDGRRKYRSALSPCDQPSGVRPNSAPYPAHRSASVPPAMPVIVQVFFEERRQGRRRGSLKGYATDAAKIGCTICAALHSINPAGGDLFQGAVDFFIKRAAFFAGATLFSGHQYLLSSWIRFQLLRRRQPQPWAFGENQLPLLHADAVEGVVRDQEIAVQIGIIDQRGEVRGRSHRHGTGDHAAQHGLHAERFGDFEHAVGFQHAAAFIQLHVDAIKASLSFGMSAACWQASSAMMGMWTLPRTQRVSSSISAGMGCSMNSTPIFSSQLILRTASSLSFQPSLASTRRGFLVTERTASMVGSSVASPTFTLSTG